MNNKYKLFVCLLVFTFASATMVSAVSEGYQFLDAADAHLFSIDNAGNINVTSWGLFGGATSGGLAAGDINISGYYYGDGSQLTNLPTQSVAADTALIKYQNITNLPTCGDNEYFTYDGSALTCATLTADSVNIAGENITSGTIALARLPSLTNTTISDYHNVTGIPTCGAGDFLNFDGSDLACATPTSAMDYTNIAMINITNTFAEQQVFTLGLNSSDDINIADTKSIIWDTSNGEVSVDAAGTFTFKLGA